jgi:DnaJ-class molecular chaperone
MGWLEFSVVLGAGLLGFAIVNAFIDYRRKEYQSQEQPRQNSEKEDKTRAEEQDHPKQDSTPRPWWEVLKVDRDASIVQIKEAFRREISKYHPDRVEGLGKELRDLADEKSKEVNRAYTSAKEQRRFS